jgi:hypothetical protein
MCTEDKIKFTDVRGGEAEAVSFAVSLLDWEEGLRKKPTPLVAKKKRKNKNVDD